MKVTKEEIYGFTGSSMFCLLIFLYLYLTVLESPVKKPKEEIVPVYFGVVDLTSGTFTPREEPKPEVKKPEPVQEPAPKPKPVEQPAPKPKQVQQPAPKPKPVQQAALKPKAVQQPAPKAKAPSVAQANTTPPITQNKEKTAAIAADQKIQEEKNRLEAEQRAQQAKEKEDQRKRDAINQQVSGAFGSGTTAQNQREGTGTATASIGNIQGNPQTVAGASSKSSSGNGYGEFSLGGRTIGSGGLPRPAYSVLEEGRIVVNITVNPIGNVIFAEIGRGTNIDNAKLRNSALQAARMAKFNGITGNNNQSGTITYRYSLK